jgi:hypothetical protein
MFSRSIQTVALRGALLAGACALLAGCVSAGEGPKADALDQEVRNNPTPELHDLALTPIQDNNRSVLAVDENLRMANEDLGRVLLLDRPSRLARQRVPR